MGEKRKLKAEFAGDKEGNPPLPPQKTSPKQYLFPPDPRWGAERSNNQPWKTKRNS